MSRRWCRPTSPTIIIHGASAALEYAVMALKVTSTSWCIGHGQCGGVRAYAEIAADPDAPRLSHSDFIGDWIKMLGPAAIAWAFGLIPRTRTMWSAWNSSR